MTTGPQLDNGFIRIATGDGENDVLSALVRARLSGVEYQIALWVVRQTWGYGKKEDWISLSQFQQVTGASRSYVCRAIDQLVTRRILVTRKSPQQTFYAFNKAFSHWVVTPPSPVTRKSPVVTSTSRASDVEDNGVVTPTSHTKENITKEIIQKKTTSRFATADDLTLADELLTAVAASTPSVGQKVRGPAAREARVAAWAEDIEKLRRIDNATSDQIRFVINWLYRTNSRDASFWRSVVLSASKLREKFDQLVAVIKREHSVHSHIPQL